MSDQKKIIITVSIVLVMILFFSSAFIVNETEQIVITEFGAPVGNSITEPGLYFKLPFIQVINRFERRFLEWDGDPNEVPTKDKRYIYVDTYARWKINDPLLFLTKVTTVKRALSRLDDIFDGETRNVVANHDLVELVRSSNRQFSDSLDLLDFKSEADRVDKIQFGRTKLAENIFKNVKAQALELGIEVLDIRFKRITYTEQVQRKIYERMISERRKIADKFRSEGQGEAQKIQGDRERDLKTIESEAYRTAEEIKGKADAEAIRIYADAYNKNAQSRELYQFIKSMETYKKTLSEKDILIMSTKSDLFQYLNRLKN